MSEHESLYTWEPDQAGFWAGLGGFTEQRAEFSLSLVIVGYYEPYRPACWESPAEGGWQVERVELVAIDDERIDLARTDHRLVLEYFDPASEEVLEWAGRQLVKDLGV